MTAALNPRTTALSDWDARKNYTPQVMPMVLRDAIPPSGFV